MRSVVPSLPDDWTDDVRAKDLLDSVVASVEAEVGQKFVVRPTIAVGWSGRGIEERRRRDVDSLAWFDASTNRVVLNGKGALEFVKAGGRSDVLTRDPLRVLLVHELTHAIDEQMAPATAETSGGAAPGADAAAARVLLLEGHADWVARAFAVHSGAQWAFECLAATRGGERPMALGKDLRVAIGIAKTRSARVAMLYRDGLRAADAIVRSQGHAGIWRMLLNRNLDVRSIEVMAFTADRESVAHGFSDWVSGDWTRLAAEWCSGAVRGLMRSDLARVNAWAMLWRLPSAEADVLMSDLLLSHGEECGGTPVMAYRFRTASAAREFVTAALESDLATLSGIEQRAVFSILSPARQVGFAKSFDVEEDGSVVEEVVFAVDEYVVSFTRRVRSTSRASRQALLGFVAASARDRHTGAVGVPPASGRWASVGLDLSDSVGEAALLQESMLIFSSIERGRAYLPRVREWHAGAPGSLLASCARSDGGSSSLSARRDAWSPERESEISVRVMNGAEVVGEVIGIGGEVAGRGVVSAIPASWVQAGYSEALVSTVRTSSGRFVLLGVPAEVMVIRAEEGARVGYALAIVGQHSVDVRVGTVGLTVTVCDWQGTPVYGASVVAAWLGMESPSIRVARSVSTDAEGNARILGVHEGVPLDVRVERPANRTDLLSVDTAARGGGTLRVSLARALHVRGTVRGVEVGRAIVVEVVDASGRGHQTYLEADGTFAFEDLPFGRTSIRVQPLTGDANRWAEGIGYVTVVESVDHLELYLAP